MEIANARNMTDSGMRAACWNSSLCCIAGRDLPRNAGKTVGEGYVMNRERRHREGDILKRFVKYRSVYFFI